MQSIIDGVAKCDHGNCQEVATRHTVTIGDGVVEVRPMCEAHPYHQYGGKVTGTFQTPSVEG
jgi:hypothetical protein